MTVGEAYRIAMRNFAKTHSKEIEAYVNAMKAAAKKHKLDEEFKKISTDANEVNSLMSSMKSFADKHPQIAKDYADASKKISELYKKELGKAYSAAWDDTTVTKMRESGKSLKKAYKLLAAGDYKGAAAAVDIDYERIQGKSYKAAMKIIELEAVSVEYSDNIGQATSEKVKFKEYI